MLKNIHRHLREASPALEDILRDMVRNWPVDRLNRLEKERQEKNMFNDGASGVTRFTNMTGGTLG